MDKYQSLRIWSYQHPNEALENEYLARFKGVTTLMTPSRKSRDFSHGMDRPLLSPFMG
ncbi:hypothetical protein IR127_11875, partial [Lactobacillus murinus]|nr:hypothetical protein [Ligilactobacillus murinus]